MFHREGRVPWDFPPQAEVSPLQTLQTPAIYFESLSYFNGIRSIHPPPQLLKIVILYETPAMERFLIQKVWPDVLS